MTSQLQATIEELLHTEIHVERIEVLQPFISYIQNKKDSGESINLNFICTHNSRRSQFSQLWAATAANHFRLKINSYSGGVEETAFNERAVASARRLGFEITDGQGENPKYEVKIGDSTLRMFSKLFDDPESSATPFAAIMTCSHADENCPHIPTADQRIPVRYEDPKAFDDTPQQDEMYDGRSKQIGSEMLYVFGQIN